MAERDQTHPGPEQAPDVFVWPGNEPNKQNIAAAAAAGTPSPSEPAAVPAAAPARDADVFLRRTRDLFRYLITTFQTMLLPEKAEQFGRIAVELETAVEENCRACHLAQQQAGAVQKDHRRNRFLLRLVVSRVSRRFSGDKATMPRSLIEGLDRYMKKAFGPIMYDELNLEADQILSDLNVDDDRVMWDRIRKTPQMRRFVDTIFIRILFRFENFANGQKIFTNIIDRTMQEISHTSFHDDDFYAVFEDLFSHLWGELQLEENRLRWDFLFGDGTSKRLSIILGQGLARWLKRKDGSAALATQRAAATAKDEAMRSTKKLADAPRPNRR